MATQAVQNTGTPLQTRVVGANGIVTTLFGAGAILGAGILPAALGLPQALVLATGAISLMLGAAMLWMVATNRLSRQFVWALAIGEVLWVAASIEALFFGWLAPTSAGWWAVVLQADIALTFAAFEFYTLRKRSHEL